MTSNVHGGGQNALFYQCLLIEISFDVDVTESNAVGVVFNI